MTTNVGPQMGAPVTIGRGVDGRKEYTFRQSWLNTFFICPERARLELVGEMPRQETDATAVGTAVHATFERAIDDYMSTADGNGDGRAWLGLDDTLGIFHAEWERMQADFDIQWVKRKAVGATNFGEKCVTRWHRYITPVLTPFATELRVPETVIYEDDKVVFLVKGTADYLDQKWGLVDWKSASRQYEEWEYKRWAVQPTVYTFGLDQMVRNGDPSVAGYEGPTTDFTYVVMPDRAKGEMPQVFTVERDVGDWQWLGRQMLSILPLIERDGDTWPLNDQHALCSEKWCPVWSSCKGAYVDPPTTK